MRIIRSRWEWFEDDSGGILHSIIRCCDKKTEQYKDFFIEYAPWIRSIHWHIGMEYIKYIYCRRYRCMEKRKAKNR